MIKEVTNNKAHWLTGIIELNNNVQWQFIIWHNEHRIINF